MPAVRILAMICVAMLGALTAAAESSCAQPACGSPSAVGLFQPLPSAEAELYRHDYRRIYGGLSIFTAPNGERSINIGGGLLYVSVLEQRQGWTRIGANQWVRSEILSNRIFPSDFAGILLSPGVENAQQLAWTLQNLRGAAAPGGQEDASLPELPRRSLLKIQATETVDGETWHQIGADRWAHHSQLARILPVERPAQVETEKWISVDLSEQVAIAYEADEPVFATLVSSGLDAWPTNQGAFQVYTRFSSVLMSGGGYNDYYFLQDVPYTMYFDGEIALHGAYWHDKFGYPNSHGCVNLSVSDAHWLYHWMQSEYDYEAGDLSGAAVYVYASGATS